jgi:hypothetical protein
MSTLRDRGRGDGDGLHVHRVGRRTRGCGGPHDRDQDLAVSTLGAGSSSAEEFDMSGEVSKGADRAPNRGGGARLNIREGAAGPSAGRARTASRWRPSRRDARGDAGPSKGSIDGLARGIKGLRKDGKHALSRELHPNQVTLNSLELADLFA